MSGIFAKYSIVIYFLIMIFIPVSLLAVDADELYRKGRFADAEKSYKHGDMDNPRDLRYRYNRGCSAFQNQDYQGAAASFSSVIRRSKDSDPEMTFRASYNLGNTAYQQNDFASAIEYYKMALAKKPDSAEAKFNLELSLKKQKEAENNPDKDKQCDKNKKDEKQKQDKSDKGKSKQDKSGEDQKSGQAKNENDKQDGKQDLSGELSSAGEMPDDKTKEEKQAGAAAMLDKKKAEALLDNIKEDRAKILQYQMKDKKDNTKSGKTW